MNLNRVIPGLLDRWIPVAPATRLADSGGSDDDGFWLRAHPVHLRADQSRLVLFDASVLSIKMIVLDNLLPFSAYGDASVWQDGMENLERDWFQPLVYALKRGLVRKWTVYPCDGHISVSRGLACDVSGNR